MALAAQTAPAHHLATWPGLLLVAVLAAIPALGRPCRVRRRHVAGQPGLFRLCPADAGRAGAVRGGAAAGVAVPRQPVPDARLPGRPGRAHAAVPRGVAAGDGPGAGGRAGRAGGGRVCVRAAPGNRAAAGVCCGPAALHRLRRRRAGRDPDRCAVCGAGHRRRHAGVATADALGRAGAGGCGDAARGDADPGHLLPALGADAARPAAARRRGDPAAAPGRHRGPDGLERRPDRPARADHQPPDRHGASRAAAAEARPARL